jgi:flagellar M-ring protein FliF
VRRLTAAIVVNDRLMQVAQKGKSAVWQNRSAEEIRNLTSLAQAAVGFDPGRGDMLTVQDLAFDENRAALPLSPVSRALDVAENSPLLVKYAALLAGILVILVFGVRPALGRIGASLKHAPAGAAKELPSAAAAGLNAPEPPALDPLRTRAQQILEEVSGHLKCEPAQSSRLLQSWIHSE